MLRYSLATLIILLVAFQFSLTSISKKPNKTPPGTQHVKPLGYYVDKDEMSIFGWREFYWYTKNLKGDSMASLCLPDTHAIKAHYGSNIYESRDPKEREFPIVGVTPAQIQKYCEFRTEAVRQVKRFISTTVTYYPVDSATYAYFKANNKTKGIKNISSNIPEIIFQNGKHKIVDKENNLINIEDHTTVYGFRCIAKYE
jgi:hypothetical protein